MVRCATILLLTMCLAGCGDNFGGRVPVSGKVTLEGQPMTSGVIYLVPLEGQGSQGNSTLNASGEFRLEAAAGLLPGRYLVRVSLADQRTTVTEEQAGGPGGTANVTFFDLIPPEWNVASKQEITVKSDGSNEFTFAIPKKLQPKKKR